MREWGFLFMIGTNVPVLLGYHKADAPQSFFKPRHGETFFVVRDKAENLPYPIYIVLKEKAMRYITNFDRLNEEIDNIDCYDFTELWPGVLNGGEG